MNNVSGCTGWSDTYVKSDSAAVNTADTIHSLNGVAQKQRLDEDHKFPENAVEQVQRGRKSNEN